MFSDPLDDMAASFPATIPTSWQQIRQLQPPDQRLVVFQDLAQDVRGYKELVSEQGKTVEESSRRTWWLY